MCWKRVRVHSKCVGSGIYIQIPPEVSFGSKRSSDDALAYIRRNPVCNIVPNPIQNFIESSLMGKIQDQSVSTYVLDSLSVFTLATGI
jgi:hypothetical protein